MPFRSKSWNCRRLQGEINGINMELSAMSEKINPVIRLEKIISLARRRKGGEVLIINAVELSRNGSSLKVSNQPNIAGMMRRAIQESATTRVRLPSGNFLAILDSRIKNIGWAAPNFGVPKDGMIRSSAKE